MNYLFMMALSIVGITCAKQEPILHPSTYSIAELLAAHDLHYTVQDQEIDGERVAVAIDIRDERVNSLQGLQDIPGIETCKKLSIRFTQIPVIAKGDFDGLAHLEKLSITQNPLLHAIKPESFSSLPQLRSLEISYNPRLKTLHMGTFKGLVSLQKLNISSHHLKRLPVDWSQDLVNLRIVYVKALGNLLIQKVYKELNNKKIIAKRGYKVRILRRF